MNLSDVIENVFFLAIFCWSAPCVWDLDLQKETRRGLGSLQIEWQHLRFRQRTFCLIPTLPLLVRILIETCVFYEPWPQVQYTFDPRLIGTVEVRRRDACLDETALWIFWLNSLEIAFDIFDSHFPQIHLLSKANDDSGFAINWQPNDTAPDSRYPQT